MGQAHGQHVYHVSGGPTWGDLILEGIIIAIPDPQEGIVYKFPSKCTAVELAARLTIDEVRRITEDWNSKLEQQGES